MKKILLINGHPDKQSYNHALANAYQQGAETHATVKVLNVGALDFNPNLKKGYHERMDWEPDLQQAVEWIQEADHLVWVFPLWWYGYPAILKGFIDRVFLPGVTFQPVAGKALPKPLLKGKTARIIVTADSPKWYYRWYMHSPATNQLKKGTLEFCGVKPVRVTYISVIKNSSETFRKKWLYRVKALGRQLK